jgi:hypothetical protein
VIWVAILDHPSAHTAVILRSRALARRLEGWPPALVVHPSRLAAKSGEHLRMTAECDAAMNRRITTAFGKLISSFVEHSPK